jgi:hypothetical protein
MYLSFRTNSEQSEKEVKKSHITDFLIQTNYSLPKSIEKDPSIYPAERDLVGMTINLFFFLFPNKLVINCEIPNEQKTGSENEI